ncbi:hypothetical protein H1R20_g3032, partial [Candolleomyces eurysporus]
MLPLELELWMNICDIACCDDGRTGRSLSLVSRTLYEASKPYKLRTVAVRGEFQIVNFARLLESLPLESRNVQNIYITSWTLDSPEGECDSGDSSSPAFQAMVALYQPSICDRIPGPEPEEIVEDRRELLAHVISRVLTSISTTVRIVHIFLDVYRDFIFLPVKFSRLEELTLQGPFDYSFKAYIPHLPVIPTLRRLKVTHASLYQNGTLIDSIAVYAPSLTHLYLRVSNIHDARMVTHLDQVVNPPSSNPDQFPSTLQKFILHPGRKEPLGTCGTGYGIVFSAKRRVFEYCKSQPKIVLLKEQLYNHENIRLTQDQLEGETEWLDRANGGLGCWDDSNRMNSLI